jgi:hypothetical protein
MKTIQKLLVAPVYAVTYLVLTVAALVRRVFGKR